MRLIPIAGFCGAGKSLAALRLALQLDAEGKKVSVCLQKENPITRALMEEYQITVTSGTPDSTGACDAVIYECDGFATGIKSRLSQLDGFELAPLTVVCDPAKLHVLAAYGAALLGNAAYSEVVHCQLKEADVVLLSHLDLQAASEAVHAMAAADAPGARIIAFSAKQGDGSDAWLEALQGEAAPALEIASVEAVAARYDCSLHIAAPMGFFPDKFLKALAERTRTALSALPAPLTDFQACTISDEGVAIFGCTDLNGIIREDRLVNLWSIAGELHIQLGANCDREYLCDVMYDVIQHTCTAMEQGMTIVGEYPSIWDDDLD